MPKITITKSPGPQRHTGWLIMSPHGGFWSHNVFYAPSEAGEYLVNWWNRRCPDASAMHPATLPNLLADGFKIVRGYATLDVQRIDEPAGFTIETWQP